MRTAQGEFNMEPQTEIGLIHLNTKDSWPPQRLRRGKDSTQNLKGRTAF